MFILNLSSFLQRLDKLLKMVFSRKRQLEKSPLIVRTVKVMSRISGFIIGVTIDIIRKETHALHVWEELHCKGKHVSFGVRQEVASAFNVAFREAFDNIPAQCYFRNIGIILAGCIGCRA